MNRNNPYEGMSPELAMMLAARCDALSEYRKMSAEDRFCVTGAMILSQSKRETLELFEDVANGYFTSESGIPGKKRRNDPAEDIS